MRGTRHFKYNVARLIRNVRDRPCLWDKTLEVYKDKLGRRNAWEEIFNELDDEYEEMSYEAKRHIREVVINKWTNIRDAFVRTLKTKAKTPYILHDHLQFLLKVVTEGEYSTEGTVEEPAKQEITIRSPNSLKKKTEDNAKRQREIDNDDEYVPKKPKMDADTSQSSSYVTLTDSYNDIDFVGVDSQDMSGRLMNEDEAFFASLLPTVVKYNEDERLEFRIEVLAVMKKIKDHKRMGKSEFII